jgi:hypothetical protein
MTPVCPCWVWLRLAGPLIGLLLLALVLAPGCSREEGLPAVQAAADAPSGPPLYEDVTALSDIRFTYRNGEDKGFYAILESLGGGVVLLDYDGDGLLDIFLPGGGDYDITEAEYLARRERDSQYEPRILGYPCKLYKNLGNFRFRDVTQEVGLDGIRFYTHGGTVGDYDRDGWPDLLVTGYGQVRLFHNVPDGKGGRRFEDVTEQVGLRQGILGQHFWATSAAFADLDGSGYPSLYICQYVNWSWKNNPICPGYHPGVKRDVCPPRQYEAVPHALYQNVAGPNGQRRFVDVTQEAGIRCEPKDREYCGKGLGVVVADVNGDGKPDIYVANDTTDNFLYLNRSTPGKLRFEEVGMDRGVARDDKGVPNGSMGADVGDPFGTGLASLWCTNYENELHALYRNAPAGGRTFFTYATLTSGIAAIGQLYVGWGTGFLDLDQDGWEDLVIINGHVIRHPAPGRAGLAQRPVLFHNKGGGKFEVWTERGGAYFRSEHRGRGLAIGDLDNDGRPDLVISHVNEPVVVLRHNRDFGHHWLGIELVGQQHADVTGARLRLEAADRQLVRFAKAGGSWASAGDRRIVFGLGTCSQPGRLTVEWPSGRPRVEHWDGLAPDRYHRLVQGTGSP